MRGIGLLLSLLLSAYAASQYWRPLHRSVLVSNQDAVNSAYRAYLEGGGESVARARNGFQQALIREPASSYRWADLAQALYEQGDKRGAAYSIDRAVELGPRSVPVLLRASNADFLLGDDLHALERGRDVLALSEHDDANLFGLYDRMRIPVSDVLSRGIPLDPRAAGAYVRHLIASNRRDDLAEAWQWTEKHSLASDGLASEYAGYLLNHRYCEAAAQVWAGHLGERRGNYLRPNRLFNGGFESPLGTPVLNWETQAAQGVAADRDSAAAHEGKWSWRVRFTGETNADFHGLYQTAAVSPGAYKFTGFIKTDHLTTDQGLRFHLYDSESPGRLDVLSNAVTGTADWVRVEKTFTAPAQTRLVTLELIRAPSDRLDSKIAGTAWVDSVSLDPIQ